MSAFTMVSLVADAFNRECPLSQQVFTQHPCGTTNGASLHYS